MVSIYFSGSFINLSIQESNGNRAANFLPKLPALKDDSHHPDPAAIRTYPGRAITDSPHIFSKTRVTNLKTTGAIPAEGHHFLAAMALKAFSGSFSPAGTFIFSHLHLVPYLYVFSAIIIRPKDTLENYTKNRVYWEIDRKKKMAAVLSVSSEPDLSGCR